jgi:hypothetical protein
MLSYSQVNTVSDHHYSHKQTNVGLVHKLHKKSRQNSFGSVSIKSKLQDWISLISTWK